MGILGERDEWKICSSVSIRYGI